MNMNDYPSTPEELEDWVAKEITREFAKNQRDSDECMKELLSINDDQLAELRGKLHKQVRQLGQLAVAEKSPFKLSN